MTESSYRSIRYHPNQYSKFQLCEILAVVTDVLWDFN